MADYSRITSRLLTGAAIDSPFDVDALAQVGVTHVVDLRAEFDDAALLADRFVYLWNGTQDDGQPKPTSWFATSIDFANQALTRTVSHPNVYLHCAAGVNRGPSATFAIMLAWGWTPDAAEQLIRLARPQVGLAYKDDAVRAIVDLYGS